MEELISHLKMNSQPNLYFQGVDILNHDDMIKTVSHFHTNVGPIVIVSEGLL